MDTDGRYHGQNVTQAEPVRPPSLVDTVRRNRFIVMQNQRKDFVLKVYLLASVFLSVTLLQWLVIKLVPSQNDFFTKYHYVTFVGLFTTVLLLTVFFFLDEIRYNPPYNWIFAGLIVEFATFGFLRSVLYTDLVELSICLAVTAAVVIGFNFLGVKCPRDLTLDIVPIAIVSLLFYLIASIFITVSISTYMDINPLPLIIIMMVIKIVFIMYIAQIISGNRTGTIRWNDCTMATLFVYFSVIGFFILAICAANSLE